MMVSSRATLCRPLLLRHSKHFCLPATTLAQTRLEQTCSRLGKSIGRRDRVASARRLRIRLKTLRRLRRASEVSSPMDVLG